MDAQRSKKDWHPADIKAALEKRGWTFARISREYGYRSNTARQVLRYRALPTERIVAEILGVSPEEIWPSRYTEPRRVTKRSLPRLRQNNTATRS